MNSVKDTSISGHIAVPTELNNETIMELDVMMESLSTNAQLQRTPEEIKELAKKQAALDLRMEKLITDDEYKKLSSSSPRTEKEEQSQVTDLTGNRLPKIPVTS